LSQDPNINSSFFFSLDLSHPTLFSSSSSLLCPLSQARQPPIAVRHLRREQEETSLSSPLRPSSSSLPSPFSVPSTPASVATLALLSSAATPVNRSSDRRATKNH
ncbi:hypothetical protein AABB24_039931, partial [Solanum stoloniferum]